MSRRFILNIFIIFLFLLTAPLLSFGQKAVVKGVITDESNKPVELANIVLKGEKKGAVSDKEGRFELEVPANKKITIVVTYIGLVNKEINLKLAPGEIKTVNISLKSSSTVLPGLEIKDR